MNNPPFKLASRRYHGKHRSHSRKASHTWREEEGSFLCKHCNAYVPSTSLLSGVQNRNHCPYCLWSFHLDLFEAGDRLSACKSPMQPIGLATKITRKKYGSGRGELMLIHLCIDCLALSINRIAADDDAQKIFSIYEASFQMAAPVQTRLSACGIQALTELDKDMVYAQLFGAGSDVAEVLFGGRLSELA